MRKKLFIPLLFLFLFIVANTSVFASNITFNKNVYYVKIGEKLRLSPKTNAKTKKWKSSKPECVTVTQNGVVTGKKPGKSYVTLFGDGTKATLKVWCINPIKKLKLNKTSLSLKKGKTYQLKQTVYPSNTTIKAVKWYSSNKKIVSVDKTGKIKALKPGTAKITVKSLQDTKIKCICKVTVPSPGKTYLIGDSRTKMMHDVVGDSGYIWKFKIGAGMWDGFLKTTLADLQDKVVANSKVIIMLGVNDCADTYATQAYAKYINAYAKEWKKKNIKTYYMAITPVRGDDKDGATKPAVKAWNLDIKNRLSSDVVYFDITNTMTFKMGDALHYQRETSKEMFKQIMAFIKK